MKDHHNESPQVIGPNNVNYSEESYTSFETQRSEYVVRTRFKNASHTSVRVCTSTCA